MYFRHAHIILVQTAAALILLLTIAASFRYAHAQSAAAHWSFNEGSGTSASDTAGGHTGVLQNGAAWVAGRSGNAVALDGIDDYVRVTDNDTLDVGTGNFTITAWVRFDAFTAGKSQPIFIKQDANTVGYAFFLDVNRHLALQGKDASVRYAETGATTLTPNTWYFVVGVGDRNGYRLYINGVQESTTRTGALTDQDGTMSNAGDVTIGANLNSGNYARAAIDEVRLYSLALSSSEIPALYAAENSTPAASKPNIIVIMTDDQDDRGTLEVMTNVKTLLRDKGVRFLNSFAANPLCCPSRATFLTGQFSHNNTVWTNFDGGFDGRKGGYQGLQPTEGNTLPVWLQQAGYTTGLIGKYLNGYGSGTTPPTHVPSGWSTWIGAVDPTNHAYYNYTMNENGALRTYGSAVQEYKTDVLSQRAVDFITAQAGTAQPFFLWLTPNAPHTDPAAGDKPVPAPRHVGRFATLAHPQPPSFNEVDVSDKPSFVRDSQPMDASLIAAATDSYRKQRETLLSVDETVANVVNALQAAGKLDNTYIIFTSDNGYFHGEHRAWWQKYLIYEESIRVPLIIRGPGITAGQTRNQLVSNVDLPATILELAQATPGRAQDGRSIMPLAHNASALGRSTLLLEGMNRTVPNLDSFAGFYSAVRTDRFVYIEHVLPGGQSTEKEFYDLSTDPYQLSSKPNDSAYSSIIQNLKNRLNALKSCTGSACWTTDPEPTMPAPPAPPPPTPTPTPNAPPPPTSPQPTPPPTTPYNPFPPVQLPNGTWVQPMNAAAGAAAGVCPVITRNLSEGARDGTDRSVSELQRLLTATGDYTYGEITGYFGPVTTAAVKKFQCRELQLCSGAAAANGYGVIGPATRAKIAQVCAGGSSTIPTPPSPSPVFTRNLRVGDSGSDVTALQELLIREGVYPEAIVSGYFGELTRRAVARFQEKYASEILTPAGLTKGTGYFGPLTRAKANQLW